MNISPKRDKAQGTLLSEEESSKLKEKLFGKSVVELNITKEEAFQKLQESFSVPNDISIADKTHYNLLCKYLISIHYESFYSQYSLVMNLEKEILEDLKELGITLL